MSSPKPPTPKHPAPKHPSPKIPEPKNPEPRDSVPRGESSPVPPAVVSRLSLYLRALQRLLSQGSQTTNSGELGRSLGFTDAQVRKDLAHFGHFGQPGIGYQCAELISAIRAILGTDRQWQVALLGVGNLGRALLGYRGFEPQGFRIVAAFDADPRKAGCIIEKVPVFHADALEQIVASLSIDLGMIAVPAEHAQTAADQLVAAGVSGILNFAPVMLKTPEGVSHVEVDLARELEQVTYSVASRLRRLAAAPAGLSPGERLS